MNATIVDLRVRLEKEAYLSAYKGFDQETHPYTIESGSPCISIDITEDQARSLCKRLLTYFPEIKEVDDEG